MLIGVLGNSLTNARRENRQHFREKRLELTTDLVKAMSADSHYMREVKTPNEDTWENFERRASQHHQLWTEFKLRARVFCAEDTNKSLLNYSSWYSFWLQAAEERFSHSVPSRTFLARMEGVGEAAAKLEHSAEQEVLRSHRSSLRNLYRRIRPNPHDLPDW